MMQIGSRNWQDVIYEGGKDLDIQVDKQKIEKFATHALELMKWNQRINLTAITDPLEIAVKHFLDSMVPVKIIPPLASVLDIGSGGGFPGIPMKICLPSLSVTLIDASRKKVSFLRHIIRILDLENTEAFHMRAEEFVNKPGNAESYNVIISRALSSMDSFVQTALPFLKKDGLIIVMKGSVTDNDIESLRLFINNGHAVSMEKNTGFEISVNRYTLPYLKSNRSMISLKKV